MDAKITKKIIKEFTESQGISVAEFFREKFSTTDTSFYRMLKTGTFKLNFIEKLADAIGISIDELIGRTIPRQSASPNFKMFTDENVSKKGEYHIILKQKDEIISKLESTVQDKIKIITLLESQMKYAATTN